ncbi:MULTISPECIES: YecR family lipoprotein [Tenebrionibacter/Tenebrionicola group]|jgi:hypothetical protein|uniref:Lipoprotein n=2 Tax=Tenebrionibacter/Tenebrionicola group TaxID=2969848 RepID=A0A8K0XVW6_9ENTR|nr:MULTISPECIES: YecR family lipoprotein [Tenebrionibacter/Tenebrionicola group]MBK4713763.1 hypothetical protein [Tenebrionibacter intestinalis]MBV4411627.1 hypothetical protein [Tenebrionicola larvae]MBV5094644.1 hypothetical protein [Tenebrionicola larvae]
MKKHLFAVAIIILTGCTFKKEPQIADSDAVSGVVRLSYSTVPLLYGVFDENDAKKTAASQCGKWGYASAQRYGDLIHTCSLYSGPMCMKETVTLEYQCGLKIQDMAR